MSGHAMEMSGNAMDTMEMSGNAMDTMEMSGNAMDTMEMSGNAMEMSASTMEMPVEMPVPAPTRAPFLAFAADAETGGTLLALAGDRGWPADSVRDGHVREATAELAGAATPETLVVDIGEDGSPFEDLSVLADACDTGTRVVVLGEVNDVALFRRLRALGVDDYLLKPVAREVFEAALRQSAPARAPEGQDTDDGRLIAVMGARGGAGASTVALNLAWTMAHDCGLRVALVDFDFGFGSIALDIEPGRGFRDALESPGRIDGLFIERAMVRAGQGLFVLAAEETFDAPHTWDEGAVARLLRRLKGDFDALVVDLPRAMGPAMPVIAEADTLVVVSDLTLAGARDSLRLLELAAGVAPEARVRIAINRVRASARLELEMRQFERVLGRKADVRLPFDPKAAAQSAIAGKALVETSRRGRLARALREFGGALVGTGVAKVAPVWARILRRGA